MRTLTLTIPKEYDGVQIKSVLRKHFGLSSALITALKTDDGITLRSGLKGVHVCNFSLDSAKVDGEVVNGSQRLIKCTLTAIDNDSQAMTVSFVVALRAATVNAQEEDS